VLAAALAVSVVHAQTAAPRPPAPSLARPATPTRTPDADGFLPRWLILEPLPISGGLTESAVRAAIGRNDVRQFTMVDLVPGVVGLPPVGDTVTIGDTTLAWHAVDTRAYNVNLYHFAYALNKPTSNVLFAVATIVHAPRELTDVRLAIGSNAASVWWLNGREVIGIYNDRQTVIDDGVSKRLTLKQGPNVIRAVILNGGGATDFCARFLDAQNRPVTGLTVSLTEATGR
jgi:hypothetical protein